MICPSIEPTYYIIVMPILSFQTGPWTQEEEANLIHLFKIHGPKWVLFSKEYLRRMPDSIYGKWLELQPVISQFKGKLPEKKPRATFTEKDDVKLLTTIRYMQG